MVDQAANRSEEIIVRVSRPVAERWRNADAQQRQRGKIALMYALMVPEEVVDDMEHTLDLIGRDAEEKGVDRGDEPGVAAR